MIIYATLLTLGFLLLFPKRLYLYFTLSKPLPSPKRLLGSLDLKPLKEGKRVLWVHSVSVGETNAIAKLISKIHSENPDLTIITSHATETGLAAAKKQMPFAYGHILFPLDYRFVWRRIFNKFKPCEVLICETDLWPNFLHVAKECGAKISVVNAKVSARSFALYKLLSPVRKSIFAPIDNFYIQNEEYLERYKELQIDPSKLKVTGNLKIDAAPNSSEKEELIETLGITDEHFVVTLGSTHSPEEKKLVKALLKAKIPNLKILVVPRHPERFNEVAGVLQELDPHFVRLSEGHKSFSSVVLIDAMGKLGSCYSLSSVAIVCGTFIETVGGHNMLEPLHFGVPTLFGPHYWSQKEFAKLSLTTEAGYVVNYITVGKKVFDLQHQGEQYSAMSEAGKKLIEQNRGATEKTFEMLAANVSK